MYQDAIQHFSHNWEQAVPVYFFLIQTIDSGNNWQTAANSLKK